MPKLRTRIRRVTVRHFTSFLLYSFIKPSVGEWLSTKTGAGLRFVSRFHVAGRNAPMLIKKRAQHISKGSCSVRAGARERVPLGLFDIVGFGAGRASGLASAL